MPRLARALEPVERELRLGAGLARADEDEAASVAGQPLELGGEKLAVRLDGGVLVDLGEPDRVAARGEHAARAREVGAGFGIGAVKPAGDEHEKVALAPGRRRERTGERGVEPRAEGAVARQPLDHVGEERRRIVESRGAREREERVAERRRVAALERRDGLRLDRRVCGRRGDEEGPEQRRREASHAFSRGSRRGRSAPSSARSRSAPSGGP